MVIKKTLCTTMTDGHQDVKFGCYFQNNLSMLIRTMPKQAPGKGLLGPCLTTWTNTVQETSQIIINHV
ncbi:Uncharacterized protein APZ42_020903 [Daphnia magna]|uniref:Uncharacterized protein n=1 Tax=Daphnia magna TaxID=35525 RepID=A0A164X4U1_9CRUS|nr:Uncharacterized protein APZ42_020903 [Daphnia magna]